MRFYKEIVQKLKFPNNSNMERMSVKEQFINIIEKFIALTAVRLSDDVMMRLKEMQKAEDSILQKTLYECYFENFQKARELNRPCCQDTGLLQFYVKTGSSFSHLNITSSVLTEAVKRATFSVPLRPNAVDYFEEKNSGDNTAERCPWIEWEIVPDSSEMEITLFLAGAGCSLPGKVEVFKPSDGWDSVVPFVFNAVYGAGINACPPLLVGIGLGHNIENAAVLSKKACLRLIGTSHPHPKGAQLEQSIMKELNSAGMGAQGLRGNQAVMAVHIESSARHTATFSCAVNVSCYTLRRGIISIKNDLSYELPSFRGVVL